MKKIYKKVKYGDIVAKKSGVLTRIVPENGTAKLNEKSYVEKGTVLIEGKMYSKFLETFDVTAKGIVKADCEYTYENTYLYKDILKEYTGKKRYTIGISINYKENMLNYLNKSKKYDISKSSKNFDIFGLVFSFDIYSCEEYIEQEIIYTKDELLKRNEEDSTKFLNEEILPNTIDGKLVDKNTTYIENEDGFEAKTVYVINEEISEFVERNEGVENEQNSD